MADEIKKRRVPSAEEISGFASQVAMMQEAGVPLYDGLEMLSRSNGEEEADELYKPLSDAVNQGDSLYNAMKEDGRWPKYMTEMVGIGEETGHLDKVMRGLAGFYEREDKIHSAVTHAITYPMLLGGLLLVIVFVMLWKVVPMFRHVLNSMGIGDGQTGSMIMNLGSTVGWIALIVFGVLLLGGAACILLMKTKARKTLTKVFYRVLPRLRHLTRHMSAARVSSVLSMTIASGYPIEQTLDMVKLILEDEEAEKSVEKAAEVANEGGNIVDALAGENLFEPLHGRMLRVASAAGNEEDTLAYLSDLYEEKAETEISRLLSIVEPTMVVVLSIVIGAILLSVMLPMAGILTSMI